MFPFVHSSPGVAAAAEEFTPGRSSGWYSSSAGRRGAVEISSWLQFLIYANMQIAQQDWIDSSLQKQSLEKSNL
jgi:hypothetical protein